MTEEIWKDVVGYEEYYQVSNIGRVRSKERLIAYKVNPKMLKSKILSQYNHNDYKGIRLRNSVKATTKLVHVLVAEAFLGKKPEGHDVNHKNCIKGDNRVENLEYCTHQENIRHAVKNGLMKASENNCRNGKPQRKLMVLHLETGIYYEQLKDLADTYGYDYKFVSRKIKSPNHNIPIQVVGNYTFHNDFKQ